ncbi:MAG: hypothetical protein ACXVSL_00575 [Solirubrobacteraceae bacterium]
MREYGYTVIEHDPARPWVIRGQSHETVQLEEDVPFFEWSAARYPHHRYTVQLDPWSLTPGR